MPRKRQPLVLENLGSLITYKDPKTGNDTFLGFLWGTPEHGMFDPTHGRVDVTPEQAKIHNQELSKALIDGLDTRCEVGQGGFFYYEPTIGVRDFIGVMVAEKSAIRRSVGDYNYIEFDRKGRCFRGKPHRNDDSIFIERIN